MKKLLFLFAILFSVTTVFAQEFKPVKMDSLVTVSMPANYNQKDTLGQHIFSATTNLGYIIGIVEPNAKTNEPLKKADDLNNVFKKYITGIQKQTGNGSAQSVRDTTIGALKGKAFTLVTDDGSGNVQYREFVLIYTKEATYTLQYGYPENRKDLVKAEGKAFFTSVKLSPELQRNDQYTDTSSTVSNGNTSKILEFGGGIIVLCVIFWLVFLRKRSVSLE